MEDEEPQVERCQKCSSQVFIGEETETVILLGSEVVKSYPEGMTTKKCLKCSNPRLYEIFKHLEE